MPGIAPWLQPADPSKNYLEAYSTSARIAEANARLQQSVAQSQREFALQELTMQERHAQQDREAEMERQRLEIAKSYHEQQAQLGQQKLEEAAKVNQIKIQQAARTSQAQMRSVAYRDELISGGMDAGRATAEAAMKFGPEMGYTGTSMASIIKARSQQAPQPTSIQGIPVMGTDQKPIAGLVGVPGSGGTPIVRNVPNARASVDKFLDSGEVNRARQHIDKLQDEIDSGIDKKLKGAAEATRDLEKKKVNAVYKRFGREVPYPEVEGGGDTGTGIKILRIRMKPQLPDRPPVTADMVPPPQY